MYPIPRSTLPYLLGAMALLAGGMTVGYWAGHEYGSADPRRDRGSSPVPVESWIPVREAPLAVFEPGVAVIGDRVYLFGGFWNSQIQASPAVWAYDAAADEWARKGDMPSAFTHANAVVVGDTVWFAGGFVGDNPGPASDAVWRYEARSDRWSPGPSLPKRRGGGALVQLGGKLHYFGGYREDRDTNSDDHWVLDLSASTGAAGWAPAAPFPKPRGHLSAVAINGLIYAIGGSDRHDPSPLDVPWVHRYDPSTDSWTEVASLPIPRSHFEPSTLIRNGRIVIIGGRSRPTGHEVLADVTEYDPIADRWVALAPLPEARHSPFAALVGDRIVAGLGGSQGSDPDNRAVWRERNDSAWQRGIPAPVPLGEVAAAVVGRRLYLFGDEAPWTLALDLGTGRWDAADRHAVRPANGNHHAAEVWQGRVYLFGGIKEGAGRVQIYDPVQETWRFGPDMPFAAASVSSALIGSSIYVAGGIVGDTTTRQAARFDPALESWIAIAPMPRGRNHAAAATDGRRLFIFGGRGPGSGDHNHLANGFDDVQIYDPVTDTWIASGPEPSAPARLPQARGGMGRAVFDGREFWVFGGETLDGPGATKDGVYDRVDVYDPALNRWRAGPAMPTARHGIFPVLAGERILVTAGGSRSNTSATSIVEVLDLRRTGRQTTP